MSKRVCATDGCGAYLSRYTAPEIATCSLHGGGPKPFDFFLSGRFAAVLSLEDWQLRAACKGMDEAGFEPDLPSNERPLNTTKAAKRACAYCPVRRECLQFAFDNAFYEWEADPDDPESGGSADGMVYGGMTGRERSKIRHLEDRVDVGLAMFEAQRADQDLFVFHRDAGIRAADRWETA